MKRFEFLSDVLLAHISWQGYPLQNPALPTPTVPPPKQVSNGSPQTTCTEFCSNDLKTGESLSKVRHVGSVRMERVIVDRSGLGWTRWFGVL